MNIMPAKVKADVAKAPLKARVLITDIIQDPLFQVREKLDGGTVTRYADAMKVGTELPPIAVMKVKGAPMLTDGWHRLAAARRLGIEELTAIISEGSEDDLRWEAARANLTHGLPLKRKELRPVFQAYVRSGQHRGRGRRVKSARDISTDLFGAVHHGTILRWMEADFPAVYRAMRGGTLEPEGGLRGDRLTATERRLRAISKALEVITANSRGISDATQRGEIIADLQAATEALKLAAPWKPIPLPEEAGDDF
jgi:hypothetical protein